MRIMSVQLYFTLPNEGSFGAITFLISFSSINFNWTTALLPELSSLLSLLIGFSMIP